MSEEEWRGPPDYTLEDVIKNLLSSFNEVSHYKEVKRKIEKTYGIKKNTFWQEEEIKKAWKRMPKKRRRSSRRRWTIVILLQELRRRLNNDECKIKEQSDLTHGLVQRYEQLSLSEQSCGEPQSMSGNTEDRSTQSNAVLETVGAAGGVKQHSGANPTTYGHHGQTCSTNQDWTGTQFPHLSQATGNYPRALEGKYEPGVASRSEENDEIICIRIPLREMFHNEPSFREQEIPNVRSDYKLIKGLPSDADIRIRKSYAMSFNTDTGNASWVYELLNRETSAKNCKKPITEFGNPYHRGHLAASANHKWCREASNDANLKSNITPQHEGLNLRTWKKLEERCRSLRGQNGICNVHVYSGPLYLRDEFGQTYYGILQGKKVPTHFFKVIIVENENGTVREPECYVMSNDNPPSSDLRDYIVDIEDIERVSGLTFIERRPIVRESDKIMSVILQGEGVNSTLHNVNIRVRISS
ncbi:hypothetical protein ABG768_020321 [Culter alburnus]|uniref:Uncharacterized protein n=1 Tax=Culter alburnus TaxID=194366 RepID=A0AAW2AXY9_CULAL